jgi:alkylhydroperoxidase family enzyme
VLRKHFFSAEEIKAIVTDFRNAGLPEEEVAIMSFARKVITDPYRIQPKDIDLLRSYGLKEEEILDVILTASARSFFSKALDAAGAQPDTAYLDTVGDLIQVLAVGRPFEENGE